MRERPILFSAPRIRAILDGRETMTRRVITSKWLRCLVLTDDIDAVTEQCPYGVPGDRLWCQEGYRLTRFYPDDSRRVVSGLYSADDSGFEDVRLSEPEWAKLCARKCPTRPSSGRHMYRSLARIRLEVVSVRVERVQEISEADCIAEGVTPYMEDSGGQNPDGSWISVPRYVYAFRDLWDSINAKRGYGWESNCWVWVVEFRRVGQEK